MNSGAAVPPPVSGWPNIDVFDVELTEHGMSPIAGMNTGASLLLDTAPLRWSASSATTASTQLLARRMCRSSSMPSKSASGSR
jgi:hypothetical protein